MELRPAAGAAQLLLLLPASRRRLVCEVVLPVRRRRRGSHLREGLGAAPWPWGFPWAPAGAGQMRTPTKFAANKAVVARLRIILDGVLIGLLVQAVPTGCPCAHSLSFTTESLTPTRLQPFTAGPGSTGCIGPGGTAHTGAVPPEPHSRGGGGGAAAAAASPAGVAVAGAGAAAGTAVTTRHH